MNAELPSSSDQSAQRALLQGQRAAEPVVAGKQAGQKATAPNSGQKATAPNSGQKTTAQQEVRVLIVEDSVSQAQLLRAYLVQLGWHVTEARSCKEADAVLEKVNPQLIFLDLGLPDCNGEQLLPQLRTRLPHCLCIVVTADSSLNKAVSMVRSGAYDYLVKPLNRERLITTAQNALALVSLRQELDTARQGLERNSFHGIYGASAQMQGIYRVIEIAAKHKDSVFITGETGTGKELVAKAIHMESPRVKGPFEAINCAAIPKDLVESELFGHVRGAFTGATAAHEGVFGRADGGTLFLDEVGEMPLLMQSKLLRFLQTGCFYPVGASQERSVNVRIVCATNRDPWQEVQAGRFREDLYYRLNVVPIALPPLRARGEDVIEISHAILERLRVQEGRSIYQLSDQVCEVFRCYSWPGNVRQLENILRNVTIFHQGSTLQLAMLGADLMQSRDDDSALEEGAQQASHEQTFARQSNQKAFTPSFKRANGTFKTAQALEQELIDQALLHFDYDTKLTAQALQLSESSIYRKASHFVAKREKRKGN